MKRFLLFFLLISSFLTVNAQNDPFLNEIKYFKKQDSLHFPPKKAILFIGSSTFTKWKDVQDYFPGHTIINRGFGGSSLPNVIQHADDVIFPYRPKQIIIYCGENDFTGGEHVTPALVTERVKQLIDLIRTKYPRVPIAYISIKPSPSRQHLQAKMVEANKMIAEMLQTMKRTTFINTYDSMLNADGTIMKDIFLSDNLHMNAKGYAIWQKIMEPYLK